MNGHSFISDEDVERSFDWLRDNANAAAKAKAERVYVEEYRKSVKALIMKKHPKLAVAAQEREAYADPDYLMHLEAIRQAVYEDERMRFLKEACLAKIDAWRTASSNMRANV